MVLDNVKTQHHRTQAVLTQVIYFAKFFLYALIIRPTLLYHMAAFVLYSFFLTFLNWKMTSACLVSINFMFVVPCIVVLD